jgi:hypothetical protein
MGTNKKTFGTRTNASTPGTPLGSEIRIDFDSLYSSPESLVFNKALELVERPSTQPEVNLLAFPHLSYSFEVFKDNSPSLAVIHNLLGDYMIPVSLETSLPARNLFKEFLAGTSAFTLESCSQPLEFEPFTLDFSSAKELPIACHSNMVYSDINTNLKSVRNLVDVDISGKCDMKKHPVMLVNSHKHSLVAPVKILPVVFRNIDGNVNPAVDSANPNLVKAESECSLVKVKRHNLLEGWLSALVGSHRFKGLRSYTIGIYDKLGGQVKQFPAFIVAKMVKLVSVVSLSFKPSISYVRYCFGVLLHGVKKQFVHRDFKFDSSYGLHIVNVEELIYKCFASHPTAKAVGIRSGGIL